MPSAARSAASRSVSDGSEELISTTSAPGASTVAIPQPSSASRTTPPLGSMVTTRSATAKAAGESAVSASGCSAANRACLAASASRTTSENPAAWRLAAIGQPMLPSPTNPTVSSFMGSILIERRRVWP